MNREGYRPKKADSLASQIIKHKRLYYAGRPIISDSEYDALEDELRAIHPNHPILKQVGSDVAVSLEKKVEHEIPMLSLQKTYDIKELIKWGNEKETVGSLKIDGNSLSLIYSEGKLVLAKTRGNGKFGENVTDKVQWVADVVPDIEGKGRFEIRGELFCTESQFLMLSKEMQELGLEKPSSPRNIVAGLLGRKSHIELARFFNFFAFEAISLDHKSPFISDMQRFEWLKNQGFQLPNPQLLKSERDFKEYLEQVKQFMIEDEIGIDGAVFSYNQLSLHDELGVTAHHPRAKMSFKWQGETTVATIVRIHWATSRLGYVTPVAVINPVNLSGATITNVTLHNAEHVKQYGLKTGDKIRIVRSGEVIPKFLEVVDSKPGEAETPEVCPSCQSTLGFDSVRLYCNNTEACPAQQLSRILHWIRMAKIDSLSEKRLESLMDLGLVKTVPDLYRLSKEDFLKLPLTKEKMAKKLYENIQSTKSIPLERFLTGLGISGLGTTSWEALISRFENLETIRQLTEEQVLTVGGFAEKTANQLISGLKKKTQLIDELLACGLTPIIREAAASRSGQGYLEGRQFVLTGSMSRPRGEIEKAIKEAGGKTTSSVSKATYALVTSDPDSTSSKAKKARTLNVQILSEDQLWEMIQKD